MADPVRTEEEKRQADIDRAFTVKDRIEVMRWIMGVPLGRKFVWWLLSEARIFSSTLGDHHVMSFNEGKRNMGLKIFQLTQADPEIRELFSTMQNEHTRTEKG